MLDECHGADGTAHSRWARIEMAILRRNLSKTLKRVLPSSGLWLGPLKDERKSENLRLETLQSLISYRLVRRCREWGFDAGAEAGQEAVEAEKCAVEVDSVG